MQEDKMQEDRLENLVETLKTLTENFTKHSKFFDNEITGDILLEYRKKFDNFQMAVRTCLDKNTEAHMEIGAQVVNDFYNAGMDRLADVSKGR